MRFISGRNMEIKLCCSTLCCGGFFSSRRNKANCTHFCDSQVTLRPITVNGEDSGFQGNLSRFALCNDLYNPASLLSHDTQTVLGKKASFVLHAQGCPKGSHSHPCWVLGSHAGKTALRRQFCNMRISDLGASQREWEDSTAQNKANGVVHSS